MSRIYAAIGVLIVLAMVVVGLFLGARWLSSPLQPPGAPDGERYPTLADYWNGRAEFVVDVADTGLPMGESDSILMRNGEIWSYVHASQRSAGVVDRCGEPVAFPGCVVIYRSRDRGKTFSLEESTCQIECTQCPCNSQFDHIDQQQYPRVAFDGERLHMVYEYRGMVMHRTSTDGAEWSHPEFVPDTGYWDEGFRGRSCTPAQRVGPHPFTAATYDCLMGGPPGVHAVDGQLYIFVALGQNPGSLGCLVGPAAGSVAEMRPCAFNPLLTGAATYGPPDVHGPAADPYYSFRTLSSVEIQQIGDRYYMLFEGIRGPGPGDAGDTQFGLGLARSTTSALDGPWELFPDNPILLDLPGNIGLGHADILVLDGRTFLYTSLDGTTRSRLLLIWR
jgi:hypothetical protein